MPFHCALSTSRLGLGVFNETQREPPCTQRPGRLSSTCQNQKGTAEMVVLPSRRSVVYAAVRDEAAHAGLAVREADQAEAPKPRLLDRVRAALRARHYSRRTEDTYIAWSKHSIFFH